MKRFLITGGAGFIGSHLSRALFERGDEIIIIDSLSSGHIANISDIIDSERVHFVQESILNYDKVLSLTDGVDGIFHLAALVSVQKSIEDPSLNHRVNIDGFQNLLEICRIRGIPGIVYASSAAVYGNDYTPPHTESFRPHPLSPYAAAKYYAEMISSVYSELYGVKSVGLRFFNVYGPRQDPSSPYSGVISKFLDAVVRGDSLCIYGDGTQTRDFVYVKDVTTALIHSMNCKTSGVFNIGTGTETSVRQLADTIIGLSGEKIGIIYSEARDGEVKHSIADISLARRVLEYEPSYSLLEGLNETFSWWKGNVSKK